MVTVGRNGEASLSPAGLSARLMKKSLAQHERGLRFSVHDQDLSLSCA